MSPPNYLKILSINIATAAIFGTVIHRAFTDWQALVRDVGDGGAWIISILYYSVYGCIVTVGAILSAVILKKFNNKKLYNVSIGVSAMISIAILELYLKINMPKMDIFWEIVAVLILCGVIFNSVFTPDVWMHNKRSDHDRA